MNSGRSAYIVGTISRMRGDAVREARLDLLLALDAVGDERLDVRLRRRDGRAVRRPVERVVPLEQQVQARHVVLHVAVGRRDDARRPAHHVVPGEERPLLAQLVADMVRRVPGACTRTPRTSRRPRSLARAAPGRPDRSPCLRLPPRRHPPPACRRRADRTRTWARRTTPAGARKPGEWSAWVCVTRRCVIVSPRVAASTASMCTGSAGPGSTTATLP